MTRPDRKKLSEKKKLLEQGYVECYYCSEPVKSKALKCPHCGRWYSSGKKALALAVATTILLAAVGAYYLMPGSPGYQQTGGYPAVLAANPTGTSVPISATITVNFDREMNRTSVEQAYSIAPQSPGTVTWSGTTMVFTPNQPLLPETFYSVTIRESATDINGKPLDNGYGWTFTTASGSQTPQRSIGAGDDMFWDRSTLHPDWATVAVQARPVLILTHSTGCEPCDAMIAICEPLSEEYGDLLRYYNLTSGVNEPSSTECFAAYDPDGEPNYVPLTTILTKGPDGIIIWHSWEGVVDSSAMSSWLQDARIYYDLYG